MSAHSVNRHKHFSHFLRPVVYVHRSADESFRAFPTCASYRRTANNGCSETSPRVSDDSRCASAVSPLYRMTADISHTWKSSQADLRRAIRAYSHHLLGQAGFCQRHCSASFRICEQLPACACDTEDAWVAPQRWLVASCTRDKWNYFLHSIPSHTAKHTLMPNACAAGSALWNSRSTEGTHDRCCSVCRRLLLAKHTTTNKHGQQLIDTSASNTELPVHRHCAMQRNNLYAFSRLAT